MIQESIPDAGMAHNLLIYNEISYSIKAQEGEEGKDKEKNQAAILEAVSGSHFHAL